MRIYTAFGEAIGEIKRDLAEMGIVVHPDTYQDKYVLGKPEYDTLELQNYVYTVTDPTSYEQLKPDQPWANEEWIERFRGINGFPVNPGEAWKHRREVWEQFLDSNGKFAYTYSERLSRNNQVLRVIERLKSDPDSRQLFISIWDVMDTSNLGGQSRVPCSIGYLLQCRKDRLNLTYLQRSADFVTHFKNDIALAICVQISIAQLIRGHPGTFTHWIGSLHMFRKDAEGVF